MINALEKIIHKFESEQSKDIRSRVVRLVLIGSILTFATLSIVSFLGLLTTWKILEFRSEDLTESTADYIEDFAEEQAIQQKEASPGRRFFFRVIFPFAFLVIFAKFKHS